MRQRASSMPCSPTYERSIRTSASSRRTSPTPPLRHASSAVRSRCRGPLDILIANHARSSSGSLDDVTAAELDLSFAVNTRSSILLAQAYAAQHPGGPGGRIVLLTSGQGRSAMPSELAYAVSKGAIEQMTRTLAAHLMPRGITVNTVNPGPNDTGWADAATRSAVEQTMPSGRWGTPSDAARPDRPALSRRRRVGHGAGDRRRRWLLAVSDRAGGARPCSWDRATLPGAGRKKATVRAPRPFPATGRRLPC